MNLMKKAHQMTKEIKSEYPQVSYSFQLGLCLSYLSKIKGEVKMEDVRITELRKLAAQTGTYNRIWNRVEELSKKIRNRKFSNEEIKEFHYKAENIITLAIEILKEEVKEEVKVNDSVKKESAIYAKYEGYDAEGMRINVGDEIKHVKGLGWIKAENY